MNKYEDKNGNKIEVDKDYDFTNETVEYLKDSILEIIDNYLKAEPGIERHILYKMDFESQDPDNKSYLLQEVYKDKWDSTYLEVCKKNKKYVYSDTMTSVQTLLNKFYETVCYDEWKIYKNEHKNEGVRYCSKAAMSKILKDIAKNGVNDKNKMFDEYFKKNEKVKEFIKYYHTIGNYIPVPHNFNVSRSGPGKTADYDMWDLTLTKIYDYFKYIRAKEKKAAYNTLRDLLHLEKIDESNKHIIESTEKWLEKYNSWKKFISENYLQDYVDLNDLDWPVKDEFKTFHNWESPFPNDCLSYFELVTETIKKRGDKILNGEKIKIEDET